MIRTVSRALTALLGMAAVLVLAAGPVGAHGGPGEMQITSATRSGGDVTVTARLTYAGDGEGVPDATVTVVVDDGTPVPMTAGATDGDYQATVAAAPGATIRVTSVEPATSVEAPAPDAAATTTTAAEGATTAADPTTTAASTGDPPTTQAPADTAPEPNGIDEAPDGGGGNVVVLVVLVIVVAAAIAAAFVLRGKKPGEV